MNNNSGKRQVCFLCATPFQIMTALHLTLTMREETVVDLYVFDQFPQADEVSCKIDKTGIFRNVISVHGKDIGKYFPDESYQSRTAARLRMTLSYLEIDRVVKTILKDKYNIPYDVIYVSCWTFINRIVGVYLAKNYGTKVVLFEDGLGSYYNKSAACPRPLDRFCRRILFGKCASTAEPKTSLIYNPDLMRIAGVIKENDIGLKTIPEWDQNGKFTDIMNNVFSYSDEDAIEEPIIIFDGLYTGEKRQIMDSFYQKVVAIAGAENVIIKKHPRDKEPETQGFKYYRRFDLPLELLCLNNNMEEKLLIGLTTTALATPKLLLDKEPHVLALNKIEEMATGTLGVKFGDIREMYHDKNKFYQAESENDALDFVKKYCERFNRK